jgi:hypothetical protein
MALTPALPSGNRLWARDGLNTNGRRFDMQVKHVNTYKFDELEESAKDRVIDNLYYINTGDDFWHESTIDDAKEIGKLIGIEIKNIYFSGFSSKGDGACFEGYYSYQKGGYKALKEYAPQDSELHKIAMELQTIQRKKFYAITCNVKHSGHYSHENCTEFRFYNSQYETEWIDSDTEEEFKEVLRDFMRWIYRQLEKEYEYQTSKKSIIETINANNYDFTVNGNLY